MRHLFHVLLLMILGGLHIVPYYASIATQCNGWGLMYLMLTVLDILYGRHLLMPYLNLNWNETFRRHEP